MPPRGAGAPAVRRGGGGGFVLLTGEIGAGKTTASCRFLEQKGRGAATSPSTETDRRGAARAGARKFRVPYEQYRAGMPTVGDRVDALNALPCACHARRVGQNNVPSSTRRRTHGRRARAAAPLDQPRDQRAQAAADHPDCLARAARAARPDRAARAARHCALPPRRAQWSGKRCCTLRRPLAVAGCSGLMPFDRDARAHPRWRAAKPRRINLLADRAVSALYAPAGARGSIAPSSIKAAAEVAWQATTRRANAPRWCRPRAAWLAAGRRRARRWSACRRWVVALLQRDAGPRGASAPSAPQAAASPPASSAQMVVADGAPGYFVRRGSPLPVGCCRVSSGCLQAAAHAAAVLVRACHRLRWPPPRWPG